MISELVTVVASCMMLTAAQFQLPIQQLATLPNIQPIQITNLPNSQMLMTQSAHSILNQETGTPLSPGLFGGLPVLVSEAAQSILDQESKIVGYSYPNNLQAILQQQHQQFQPISFQSSPQLFSNIPNEVERPSQQLQPQSLSIPLLNNDRNMPGNVVPVRAVVSLKNLLTSRRPSDSASNKQNVGENSQKSIYYDIPPNHPVPPPPSYTIQGETDSRRHPGRQNKEFQYNQNRENQHASYHNDRQPQPSSNENGNQDNLRRPPPSRNFFGRDPTSVNDQSDPRPQNQWTPSQDNRERDDLPLFHKSPSASQEQSNVKSNEETEKVEKRKKSKNRHSKSSSTKEKSSSTSESRTKVDSKRHNADSATDASESSFLTSLLSQYQSANPPPPSYEINNNFQQGDGYTSNDDQRPLVHKHIFVHAAPEQTYSQTPRIRVIRPTGKPEQHVQIIFVKSPTEAPQAQTIVEVQPQQQPKTLVYILSKKPEDNSGNVRVVSPPPSRPHSPEIYFIRYGDRRENQGYPVPDLKHLEDTNFAVTKSDQGIAGDVPAPLDINQFPFLRQKRNKDYGLDVYAPLMAYSSSGQINEITKEEADSRQSNLDAFF